MKSIMSIPWTKMILVLIPLILNINPIEGGQCWTSVDGRYGRCNSLLKTDTTREDCCTTGGPFAAFTDRDYKSGEMFFLRAFQGGIPCQSCDASCAGLNCGKGKRCSTRSGVPRCVCDITCSREKRRSGQVCGTDGKTYKHICRLIKAKCLTEDSLLKVAYLGPCKDSCEDIDCPSPKTCLLDQNQRPHCVKCKVRCPPQFATPSSPVCGSDGLSYKSTCHLYEAACSSGRSLRVVYPGVCRSLSSSSSILRPPLGLPSLLDSVSSSMNGTLENTL